METIPTAPQHRNSYTRLALGTFVAFISGFTLWKIPSAQAAFVPLIDHQQPTETSEPARLLENQRPFDQQSRSRSIEMCGQNFVTFTRIHNYSVRRRLWDGPITRQNYQQILKHYDLHLIRTQNEIKIDVGCENYVSLNDLKKQQNEYVQTFIKIANLIQQREYLILEGQDRIITVLEFLRAQDKPIDNGTIYSIIQENLDFLESHNLRKEADMALDSTRKIGILNEHINSVINSIPGASSLYSSNKIEIEHLDKMLAYLQHLIFILELQ